MGLQQKPGISITENLIASNEGNFQYIPTVAFLSAERGISNVNTIVSDQVDFINKFGYPSQYNYKTWYNIYEYLRYKNNINVMRVIETTWENYGIEFGSWDDGGITPVKNNVELTDYYNDDIAFNTLQNYTFDSSHALYSVINREVTQTKDIAVAFCTTDDEYDSPITAENDILTLEDMWYDAAPTQLSSTMEEKQLYVLNIGGTHSIKQITYLTDEDISEVSHIKVVDTYYTQIKIANNSLLWSGGSFVYTGLYFRDTKNKDLNNSYYGISGTYGGSGAPAGDPAVEGDSVVYIVLTQNLPLDDTTGKVVFYDSTTDVGDPTGSPSSGYLKSEEKHITISGGDLVYPDTDDIYEYIVNGEVDGVTGAPYSTRVSYDSKIQNGTDIKTFRNIFNKYIDFNKNFCFLVFKKYSGRYSMVEAYEVAKERDTTTNAMYKRNYCEDTINQNSQYVYFVKNASYTDLDVITNTYSITELILQAVDDTTDFTDLNTYSTFETATNFYRNIDNIPFKYILGVELDDGGVMNMNLAPLIANDRKDCIAILSPWNESDYLDDYENMTGVLLNEFGIKNNPPYIAENNTYTIVYDNMKMIYSEFLEEYKWVPIIGDIAGVYTIEDDKSPYTAAAGFQTIPIKNVIKMLYTDVSSDNKDLLCYHSINHVLKNYEDNEFYLFDILMYYDDDVLTKRLNIRRTLNHFKYNLRTLLKPYIYEFNSYPLRSEITSTINLMIGGMIDGGGLYGGQAVCDGTNNNDATIGQNELHIQILVQPTQVIRQIYIEINIEKQSMNITESEV